MDSNDLFRKRTVHRRSTFSLLATCTGTNNAGTTSPIGASVEGTNEKRRVLSAGPVIKRTKAAGKTKSPNSNRSISLQGAEVIHFFMKCINRKRLLFTFINSYQ